MSGSHLDSGVMDPRATVESMLRVDLRGSSELVRDQSATFFTARSSVSVLDPTQTQLVVDASPEYRKSRLWLEALLRESPIPMADTRIVAGHRGLPGGADAWPQGAPSP